MTHLINAPDAPGPILTSAALILAAFVLLGVLIVLTLLHTARRGPAKEDT